MRMKRALARQRMHGRIAADGSERRACERMIGLVCPKSGRMSSVENPDSINDFWFGSDTDDAVTVQQRSQLWWSKNPEVDLQIRTRFASYVEAAAAHEFDAWQTSPGGVLALILLTDQFPRHIYRDTAKAFASDPLARAWCRIGIEKGMDGNLRPIERAFFYLPLEHSESLEEQNWSVRLFTQLYQEVPPEHMDIFRRYLMFALRHRRVIERFGRFPHRNKMLGRVSTLEEEAFLQESGASF